MRSAIAGGSVSSTGPPSPSPARKSWPPGSHRKVVDEDGAYGAARARACAPAPPAWRDGADPRLAEVVGVGRAGEVLTVGGGGGGLIALPRERVGAVEGGQAAEGRVRVPLDDVGEVLGGVLELALVEASLCRAEGDRRGLVARGAPAADSQAADQHHDSQRDEAVHDRQVLTGPGERLPGERLELVWLAEILAADLDAPGVFGHRSSGHPPSCTCSRRATSST